MKLIRRLFAWLSHLLAGWSGEEVAVTRGLSIDGHPLETRVRLQLDRVRTLRWTNLEAMRFKKCTGIDLWKTSINPLDWEIEHFMEFLAVACLQEDPDVTSEGLARYVAGQKVTEAMAAVMMLLSEWAPPLEAGGDENPLLASARSRLERKKTGRSQRKRWGSASASTGG